MRVALSLSLVAFTSPALADPCEAPLPKNGEHFFVKYIIDGDGFCVAPTMDAEGLFQIEVRLADFNACKLNEPGGPAAKESLRKIVFGTFVECVAGKRSYDRVVTHCTVEGQKVGDVLRRASTCEGGRGARK